jgi:hypothetical protein
VRKATLKELCNPPASTQALHYRYRFWRSYANVQDIRKQHLTSQEPEEFSPQQKKKKNSPHSNIGIVEMICLQAKL